MEQIVNKALDLLQKRSIRKSRQKAAEQRSLKGLLTSKSMIPKGFKRSYASVKKLENVNVPYLEMPQSSLKAFGVLPFKKRKEREFL